MNTRSAVRPVSIANPRVSVRHNQDGSVIVASLDPLAPYPARFTAHLQHWAGLDPGRCMLAERGPDGGWRRLSYAEAWAGTLAIAQALLDRGLTPERPVMILSGNGIDHALLMLGALHAGVPVTPVSTAYALAGGSFEKLRAIAALIEPGLVFAADAAGFAAAFAAIGPGPEYVCLAADAGHTPLAALRAATPTAATIAAEAVGPDTVAKVMLTSGSTGSPKAVATTNRMLCSNQQMLLQTFPFLGETPPVLVDWLPWSHTFGGSHNLGIVIANGGTMYIDEGRPVPGGFEPTVSNLREIAPTLQFNVPKGYEELVPYLERDAALRATFFSRLQMLFYSAASLQPWVLEALDRLAEQTIGAKIQWMTSLGCTETAPAAMAPPTHQVAAGVVGLPMPGVELKLAPAGDRMEARLRGPNVMTAYWRNPEATRAAFDADGFYCMGDALEPVVAGDYASSFRFDGRLVENFKLSSGSFVLVGALRLRLLTALAPHVRDVVIAGQDRDYIALLAIPEDHAAIREPAVRAALAEALVRFGAGAGSAARPLRLGFLTAPLSVDTGELTDKGSISQRTILRRHAALVDRLYQEPVPDDVICVRQRVVQTA